MKRSILALICALGLALSLAGCAKRVSQSDDSLRDSTRAETQGGADAGTAVTEESVDRDSTAGEDVEPTTPSAPSAYYDTDEVTLSGTLHSETYNYKGMESEVLILVLDEPIDCYVASYRDFCENDNQPSWHYGVTNVSVLFDDGAGDVSGYVGSYVTLHGILHGGGKWSPHYDESGTFQEAAGDASLTDASLV